MATALNAPADPQRKERAKLCLDQKKLRVEGLAREAWRTRKRILAERSACAEAWVHRVWCDLECSFGSQAAWGMLSGWEGRSEAAEMVGWDQAKRSRAWDTKVLGAFTMAK